MEYKGDDLQILLACDAHIPRAMVNGQFANAKVVDECPTHGYKGHRGQYESCDHFTKEGVCGIKWLVYRVLHPDIYRKRLPYSPPRE